MKYFLVIQDGVQKCSFCPHEPKLIAVPNRNIVNTRIRPGDEKQNSSFIYNSLYHCKD